MHYRLTSLSKTKLTFLRNLKKRYKEENLVLAEGKNCIEQLVLNGFLPEELYITPDTNPDFPLLKVPVFEVKERDLCSFCDTRNPSGLAALYKIPQTYVGDFKQALYLDGISDPGNMGTIFRSVAAFGIEAVFLSPACCEVFSPKVIRSSLGSVFWVKHERIEDERLFSDKHDLISIIQDGAILLQDYEASSTTPSIYIIGSEANGIRQELLTRSQTNLRLQMMGRMESLNASVTAGIVCWWLSLKQ